jgi:hypothetical protein
LVAVSAAALLLWPSPFARGEDVDLRSVFESSVEPGDGETNDWFGTSVAVSGATAIVGAYFEDEEGPNAGAAYIFRRIGPAWRQLAKITASDAWEGDYFGISVAISGDTAIVGAVMDDDKGGESGAAYVYTDTSAEGDWSSRYEAKLLASDGAAGDNFGWSVGIAGNRAIVGARQDKDLGIYSGSAFVFLDTSVEGNWSKVKQVKLLPSDGRSFDYFGWAVSIYGNAALVGAHSNDAGATNSGAAYLFLDTSENKDWSSAGEIKLAPADPSDQKQFGYSVALAAHSAMVGAKGEGEQAGPTGAAYLFRDTSAAHTWDSISQTKITSNKVRPNDMFGWSVGISGRYAAVGAYLTDHEWDKKVNDLGAIYLYADTSAGGDWSSFSEDLVKPDNLDKEDWFGYAVAVSGSSVIVGAPLHDSSGTTHTGTAYMFDARISPPIYAEKNPANKWLLTLPSEGGLVKPGRAAPEGRVGFEVSGSDDPQGKIIFGTWSLGLTGDASVFPLTVSETGMSGRLYSAHLTFRNDAWSANACPGYRVEYTNAAFTHFGGIEVTTTDPADAPSQGNDYVVSVVWEVPFACNDMGDAGTLANWPLAPAPSEQDLRRYTLIFDLFHKQSGDSGIFTLEEISAQTLIRPTTPKSSTVYDNLDEWIAARIPDPFFDEGIFQASYGSVTLLAGPHDSKYGARFIGAFAPLATGVGQLNGNPPCENERLVHLMVKATSARIDTTPMTRLFIHAYMSEPKGTWGQPDFQFTRNVLWFDIFGALEPFAKLIAAYGGRNIVDPNQPNPGVPKGGGGTVLSTWAFTHEGYDEVNDYLLPDIQVLSLNRYVPDDDGWPDDSGGVSVSDVAIEVY